MMRQQSYIIDKFDRCLQVFLLFAPIIWLPGILQNSLQFTLLNFGGLILFVSVMFFGQKRETKNPMGLAVLSCIILSSLFVNAKAYPLGLIPTVAGILLYYAIVLGLKDIKKIIWILFIIGIINALVSLCQISGLYLVYDKPTSLNLASFGNDCFFNYHMSMPGLMARNYHLAISLIMTAPLCFILNKWLGWLMTIIATIFAFVIRSYACRLALLASLCILLTKYIGVKRTFILGLVLLSFVGFVKRDTLIRKFNARKVSYEAVIKDSMVNIFEGRGLGSFDSDMDIYSDKSKVESSYNQFFRLGYELGWVQFLFIICALIVYFIKFRRKNIYFISSMSAIVVYAMFHEVLRFARFDILIITIFALFEVSCIDRQKEIQDEQNISTV